MQVWKESLFTNFFSPLVVPVIPVICIYTVNCVLKAVSFFLKGVMGAVIAPLTLLGGPLMVRAAWYTAGIVGGLSTVAMCAPSEKFLNMGGPLAVGFGVIFASSLG